MAALALLAILLVGRVGPFCEVAAQAVPIASAMAGCETEKSGAPEKRPELSACATPCTAVPGETLARVELLPVASISPAPTLSPEMGDWLFPPATPPPRSV